MSDKGSVRVYAAGGCGINIGAKLSEFVDVNDKAAANIDVCFVDTSKSNLARNRHSVDVKKIYTIDGVDGSGKIRAENYGPIMQHAKDMFKEFPPMDLNIVIHSASGGSGAVLGAIMADELIDRNQSVVVLLIGSTSTYLETENTIKTIKSYEAISKKKETPIVAFYCENSDKNPRENSDKSVIQAVLSLSVLFSKQNHELDSQDLYNWLRYDRVTSFKPQLAALTITDGRALENELTDLGHVISVATVGTAPDQIHFPVVPDYQCSGFLDDSVIERLKTRTPFNFIISDGVFPETFTRLENFLKSLNDHQAARIVKRDILKQDDKMTDNGLIL